MGTKQISTEFTFDVANQTITAPYDIFTTDGNIAFACEYKDGKNCWYVDSSSRNEFRINFTSEIVKLEFDFYVTVIAGFCIIFGFNTNTNIRYHLVNVSKSYPYYGNWIWWNPDKLNIDDGILDAGIWYHAVIEGTSVKIYDTSNNLIHERTKADTQITNLELVCEPGQGRPYIANVKTTFIHTYQDPTLEIVQVDNTLTANATVDESLEDKSISYLWNTGATTQSIDITESGTYSCTVTDSVGNSVTQSIDAEYIEPIHEPTVTISRSGYVLKANATIDERLEDQTVTYLWNTGETSKSITVNETGNYTCTITDSLGQTASASYYIVVEYDPVALISADKKTCLCGEKITLSGCNSYCQGSEITSYLWSTGDTTDTIEVKPEDTTIYTLTVTALNGRSSVASVKINVVTGEIELMKYLPQYWHENAEMQQIQKKTLNYLLFNLQYSSNIITTEAFIGTSNNDRLSEWEHDLGITSAGSIEARRENVLSFFKRKGKLNEAVIKAIVNNFANGSDCRVEFIPSVIRVLIRPRSESETMFPKVESILNAKKPAHLGLYVDRFYCTWGEVKDNFATWNDVNNKGTWNDVRLFLPD